MASAKREPIWRSGGRASSGVQEQGRNHGSKVEGTTMASAGARAYMRVWGLCPRWGPGAKPLVRGSGGFAP
jgi:hypothetical protein